MTANQKLGWRKISEGWAAPNFNLQCATTGNFLNLESYKYKRLILAFIPGVWAPWCRKYLDELDTTLRNFGNSDLKLIVVVSQNYDQLRAYVKSQKLKLEVLSDPNGVVGKRYGIWDDNNLEPMRISKPSIFILDSRKNFAYTFIGKHLMDRPQMNEIISKATEPLDTDYRTVRKFGIFLKRIEYGVN